MKTVIVAEAGLNHCGSLASATALADEAFKAGANIVKFQTYIPDKVIRRTDPDFKVLSDLALTKPQFKELARVCGEIGIEFMSTPGDRDSLRFLVEELGVQRIKIGSDDLTNSPLLFAARQSLLPIILSTGMANLVEIYDALCCTTKHDLTLLHCVSCYPTHLRDANIGAIPTMREKFSEWEVPIGYSDHTRNADVIALAVGVGAVMVEAHLKLMDGPTPVDDVVSFSPRGFAEMVKRVRDTETAMGHGRKEPCRGELAAIPKLRKADDGLRGLNGYQLDLPL